MPLNDNIIDAKEEDYLYIQESLIPNAGMGLFTAITIFKGETISIFKGEILSEKEASDRAASGQDQYFIMMLTGSTMDSKNIFCYAKYANDAKGSSGCPVKNNAMLSLDENDRVCLIAKTKIKAGSEILVSYGKRYWKRHS